MSREEAALMLGPPSDAQRQAIDLKRGVPAISPRSAPRRRAQRLGCGMRRVWLCVQGLGFGCTQRCCCGCCWRQVLRVQRWSFALLEG